jgi:hypothetical protein
MRVPPATAPAASAAPTAPRPASVRVPLVAALCRGDSYLAWAQGSVPAGTGPQSPAFRHGIGQVTQALFPSQNPEQKWGGADDRR